MNSTIPPNDSNKVAQSDLPNRQQPINRKQAFWILLLVAITISFFLLQQLKANSAKKQHQNSPQLAVLATAYLSNVPVYLTAIGTVTSTYSVTVKTQVNGRLIRVLYREGQTVKAGDLLAEIDPKPYQAQLVQYEGQFARDQALLANARLDLKRYQTLFRQDSVAKQVLDTQMFQVKQYEGAVKIDQGQIDGVRVNLGYTRVTSPINGRAGLRLVDEGNFVQTSDPNGLVVINTIDPITVIFTLPEDSIPQVMEQINAGVTLTVNAYDRSQDKLLATGKLLTIDNQIDTTTGTVKLKAQFENKDNKLFPNQFVNIRLLVKTLQNVTVVPTAAVQHGAPGTFVYLVNKDIVNIKPVTVGVTVGDSTVIAAGVLPGQAVVIEGVDKLTDGAKIITSPVTAPTKNLKPAY